MNNIKTNSIFSMNVPIDISEQLEYNKSIENKKISKNLIPTEVNLCIFPLTTP